LTRHTTARATAAAVITTAAATTDYQNINTRYTIWNGPCWRTSCREALNEITGAIYAIGAVTNIRGASAGWTCRVGNRDFSRWSCCSCISCSISKRTGRNSNYRGTTDW
jgi:hypothetical protein